MSIDPNFEMWAGAFDAHHDRAPTAEDAFQGGREFEGAEPVARATLSGICGDIVTIRMLRGGQVRTGDLLYLHHSQPAGACDQRSEDPTPWVVRLAEDFVDACVRKGYVSTSDPTHARLMAAAGAAAPDEGADDPLAKAILKGLTNKQLRDKALYLMALNANQARTIDALQADKYCSQCRKTKGADPALGADLHKFMDAAAGEGLVLDGVDAADLYVKLFPAEYAALSASKGEAATPSSQGGQP